MASTPPPSPSAPAPGAPRLRRAAAITAVPGTVRRQGGGVLFQAVTVALLVVLNVFATGFMTYGTAPNP